MHSFKVPFLNETGEKYVYRSASSHEAKSFSQFVPLQNGLEGILN